MNPAISLSRAALRLVPPRPPRHLRRAPTPRNAVHSAVRWARGTASVALRYPFEAVPPWRRAAPEGPAGAAAIPDLARPWPGEAATLQRVADGVGPLFHRRYWIEVAGAELGPTELVTRLLEDVNAAAPSTIGRFEDASGRPVGALQVGEECRVHLPGPWAAPVRLVDVQDDTFTLATLIGHIEAGEITFRALRPPGRAVLRFEIESWARSSAPLLHVLYDVVPIARELQVVMWSRMCRNVVDLAGGTAAHGVRVHTERRPWPPMDTS